MRGKENKKATGEDVSVAVSNIQQHHDRICHSGIDLHIVGKHMAAAGEDAFSGAQMRLGDMEQFVTASKDVYADKGGEAALYEEDDGDAGREEQSHRAPAKKTWWNSDKAISVAVRTHTEHIVKPTAALSMQLEEMKTLSAFYESSTGDVNACLWNEFVMLKCRFKAVGLVLSRGSEVLSADEIKSAQDAVVQGVVGPEPLLESTAQQQLTWYLLRVNFQIEKAEAGNCQHWCCSFTDGASAPLPEVYAVEVGKLLRIPDQSFLRLQQR